MGTGRSAPDCESRTRSPAVNRRLSLTAVGLAAGVAVAAVVATRHGPLLAPDSVTYLSMARNLTHGRGVSDFTGGSIVVFGPGYPAVVARVQTLGLASITAARTVDVVTYVSVVLLALVMIRRRVSSWRIVLGATVLFAACVQLLITAQFVSSDVLFFVLVLVFILAMEEIAARSANRVVLIGAAAVVVWAAVLVRWAGLTLLVAGVITLLITSRREGRWVALRRAVGFGVVASIGPVVWSIRNARTTGGSAVGLRVHSNESVLSIAVDVGRAAAHLMIPDSLGTPYGVLLMGGVIGLAAGLGLIARRELAPRLRGVVPSLVPTVVFVVVYLPFVAAARKSTGSDLDPRILLPAWLPTLVVGAWFFEQLLGSLKAGGAIRLARVLVTSGLALLAVCVVWYADQVRVGTAPSVAVSHYPPTDSATRGEIGLLDPHALVVSNDPWRVYNATGHIPVKLAPMPILPGFSHTPISVADLARAVDSQGSVTLVWFDRSPASGTRPVTALPGRGHYRLARSSGFSGGARYTLEPQRGARP